MEHNDNNGDETSACSRIGDRFLGYAAYEYQIYQKTTVF